MSGNSRYQTRDVSWSEVVERLKLDNIDKVAPLIVAVSPCRSGSTALVRVFAASGVCSHYQEIKNILRWRMLNREMMWQIPEDQEVHFLKETLGPYRMPEAALNPIEILLEAGYPKEKLSLLVFGRTPLATWHSWLQYWSENTSLNNYIETYLTTERTRQYAISNGVHTVTMVYEAYRDNLPAVVIKKLLAKFNIGFTKHSSENWHELPRFGEPGSNIHIPDEPKEYFAVGTRDRVKQANEISYFSRKEKIHELSQQDIEKIWTAGLPDYYAKWRIACMQDLSVDVAENDELGLRPMVYDSQ